MAVLVKSAKLINKNTDSKGRVTLGARLASRTVIIQEISDTELLVQLARVIPENALGLHARAAVQAQGTSGSMPRPRCAAGTRSTRWSKP